MCVFGGDLFLVGTDPDPLMSRATAQLVSSLVCLLLLLLQGHLMHTLWVRSLIMLVGVVFLFPSA